jgi:hypothetical protein
MAKRIQKVEIFATGKHFGSETVEMTEDDLTEMVNSFNALGDKEGFRPVLKLGHEDAQKFFGQRKGAPNLGFVEKIWKEGGKILADFANVPDALVDLIGQRRYNAVSIEMFPKTEVGGSTFTNVLTAVALLGAELPAVKGLKELAATLFTEEPEKTPDFTGSTLKLETSEKDHMFTQEQVDALVSAAVAKAEDVVKAEFEAKVAEADAKVADAEKKAETAETALRTYEDDTRKKDAETMVDDAIKAGKLTPAQKDEALAFALNLGGMIKFGDTEKSAADVFKSFLDNLPAKVDLDEHGAGGENDETKPANAGEEIDQRAKKLLAEKKAETYADARTMVLNENPKLKQRYFEMGD